MSEWIRTLCRQRLPRPPAPPQPCLLCTAPGTEPLCPGCELELPYLAGSPGQCRICALPLASDSPYCPQCLHEPPAFELCRVPCRYESPLDWLIHAFKYRGHSVAGRALSRLLGDYLVAQRETGPPQAWPELLVPVPMHWSRRLHRGFNQTELLAADLGRQLGLPAARRALVRRRRTPPQPGLSRRQRAHNLRGACTVRQPHRLAGRRVALVDDVVTTAATARTLARLLIEAGASGVELWALARTPDESHSRAPEPLQ